MGKLHELLAVEPDLKGAAEKILAETVNTFTKKRVILRLKLEVMNHWMMRV